MGGSQTAPSSPAMSRSNSVASNLSQASHKSEPTCFSTYNGVDTTGSRKSSTTSVKTTPISPSHEGHGLKSFFSAEGRAERKERKRLEQEKLEKTVLTSRHAATVKTRMMLEQHNLKSGATKTAQVQGTVTSAHTTAAAQEARLPHSGPPALHATHKDNTRDLPLLTRIVSGDERDEEDERLQRDREEWLMKKADVTMRRVAEGDDSSGEESVDFARGEVVQIAGTRLVGAALDGHKPVKMHTGIGAGWTKNDAGMWTRAGGI